MIRRHRAGRATGSIMLLLVAMGLGAGWNYHRNWQAEKASEGSRPFQDYAVQDLESLRVAYVSELSKVRLEFDSAISRRARPVDVGSIAGNVEQFQKTTRASSAIRKAAAGVAEREGQLEELKRELKLRAQFGHGLARHLKRLTSI